MPRLEGVGVALGLVPFGHRQRHLHRVGIEVEVVVADAIFRQQPLALGQMTRCFLVVVGRHGQCAVDLGTAKARPELQRQIQRMFRKVPRLCLLAQRQQGAALLVQQLRFEPSGTDILGQPDPGDSRVQGIVKIAHG